MAVHDANCVQNCVHSRSNASPAGRLQGTVNADMVVHVEAIVGHLVLRRDHPNHSFPYLISSPREEQGCGDGESPKSVHSVQNWRPGGKMRQCGRRILCLWSKADVLPDYHPSAGELVVITDPPVCRPRRSAELRASSSGEPRGQPSTRCLGGRPSLYLLITGDVQRSQHREHGADGRSEQWSERSSWIVTQDTMMRWQFWWPTAIPRWTYWPSPPWPGIKPSTRPRSMRHASAPSPA